VEPDGGVWETPRDSGEFVCGLSACAFASDPIVRVATRTLLATRRSVMIHPQVHLRIPCYDFYDLYPGQFAHLLGHRWPTAKRAYGSNPKSSLTGAIGSSDGRCVQRAGT
jgi:hypothetical protein